MRKLLLMLMMFFSLLSYSQKAKINKIVMNISEGGTIDIPVTLNKALLINFVVDTGASESSIPLYIVNTLIKTETILTTDRLEDKTYILANGTTMTNRRVQLRNVRIGDFVLENISFSVSDDVRSPLLIGQNILSQFKSVEFDYANKKVILVK